MILWKFVKTYNNIHIVLKVSFENKFQTHSQYQNTLQLITFALVSNDPNPQNVPPPIAEPPILSNDDSDSTYNKQTNKQ